MNIEKSLLNFYYWVRSANKVKIDVVSDQFVTLYPKQFTKVILENPKLSFFELDKFLIDKKIIDSNWITFRGAYLSDTEFTVYLFNEGEYEFKIFKGMNIGSAVLEKMSFIDWNNKK